MTLQQPLSNGDNLTEGPIASLLEGLAANTLRLEVLLEDAAAELLDAITSSTAHASL
jgi:hypothetical protein